MKKDFLNGILVGALLPTLVAISAIQKNNKLRLAQGKPLGMSDAAWAVARRGMTPRRV